MTINNINMKSERSGRNKHRFLIKEAYRLFEDRGYDVKIEYKFTKDRMFKADVFASNKKERIVVECLIRPTLAICVEKQKYRKYCNKLILIYPNDFVTTFPLENFFDESICVEIPEGIKKLDKVRNKTTIEVEGTTRIRINYFKYNLKAKTHDETLNKVLDIVEKMGAMK